MTEEGHTSNTAHNLSARSRNLLLEILPVASLLILYAIIVSSSTFNKSAVFDEPFHITGGYNYLKNGDLRMCSEGGFFTEALLALPLLPEKLNFPGKGNSISGVDEWENTRDFIFRSGNDTESIILTARSVVLTISILLGISIYLISRSIFGHVGGLISLCLYVFCPEILAHGGLATTDMISTFVFIAAAWAVWKLVNGITLSTLALSSAALAVLFISKHSAPFIIPYYLIMMLICIFSERSLHIRLLGMCRELRTQKDKLVALLSAGIINSMIILLVIWGACGFKYSMLKDDSGPERISLDQTTESFLKGGGSFGKAISIAKDYRILPEAYLYGYAFFIKFGQKRYAFLDGELSSEGWWYFFIFSFIYKTPIPMLLLLCLCLFSFVNRTKNLNSPLANFRTGKFWDLIPFAVFIVLFLIFAMSNRSNICNRHLLPIYPAVFILCGFLSAIILEGRRLTRWVVFILLASSALASVSAWPNYISYMNLIAGGQQNGYKHLVDSSLDWGQDLKELKKWLDNNNSDKKEVYFSCFSNSDISHYGLKTKVLPSYRKQNSEEIFELGEGIYCISATMFQFLYLAEQCYTETGFDLSNSDDKYFENLSAEVKPLLKIGISSGLSKEQRIKVRIFEYLRFIKLCLYLHSRSHDANVGNSILVFRLSNQEIEKAQASQGQ